MFLQLKTILKKFWDSPTIMTWMSNSTKALFLFGVLPLVLKKFSPSDIVLWYLFWTIINSQYIADFGFRQTFSRIISYGFKGAKDIGTFTGEKDDEDFSLSDDLPNIPLLINIISTMKYIYLRITIILFFLTGIIGTWAMMKPVNDSSNIHEAWLSWIIVLVVSCIGFYGKIYMNFLEGLNKIAIVRRIETLTSLGGLLTSILVLIFFPSLLNLVIVNQFWALVVTLRDWYMCRTVDNDFYKKVSHKIPFDKTLFLKIWKPSWRSGISAISYICIYNFSSIIYARIGNTEIVASYLLAFRIIGQIRDISMAPFYSKLPLLAMFRVKNDIVGIITVVKKGMMFSHLVFVIGFIIVGLFSTSLLQLIGSNVQFVDQKMWILLGLAFFAHRFGGMHIQVYMSTNHIIAHIADGVAGILFLISSLILFNFIGIYAIPVAMLIGYMGFYVWYAARYSYRSMGVSFWNYEKNVSLIPVALFGIYIVTKAVIHYLN